MKRRLALIVPVVVALVAIGAVVLLRPNSGAHARGGGWVLSTNLPPPTLDGVCAFRLDIAILTNQEYTKSEPQPDGTVVIQVTGALKMGVTNDSTGKTIDYNISGPGTVTIYPDGSSLTVSEGLVMQPFPPAAQQTYGIPALAYLTGHTTFGFDASGNVTSFSHVGSAISDVCAALS